MARSKSGKKRGHRGKRPLPQVRKALKKAAAAAEEQKGPASEEQIDAGPSASETVDHAETPALDNAASLQAYGDAFGIPLANEEELDHSSPNTDEDEVDDVPLKPSEDRELVQTNDLPIPHLPPVRTTGEVEETAKTNGKKNCLIFES
jgi:alkanesulfonate monooxygenase SsuD/methylene tetrahydromethanopterin reductase-like flavin-dependent oxidoreductase (luciferase family)